VDEVRANRIRDLHLETATVRESLQFSAMLRQPKTVSKKEKHAYVEEVIKMLNMADFANAVVGVPGEGLNVEQRKLLTIGVELAAKPKLLLFLDEPTSGLDSQVSMPVMQSSVPRRSIAVYLLARITSKTS
jgi:ATP-binding cassette subfamily G (WHITE) protein 2 (PDR)